MPPFDAYNKVINDYKMEEEIILRYEIEAEKMKSINELNIKPKEIETIKKKIKNRLFNVILEKVS